MSYHKCLEAILDLPINRVFDETSSKLEGTTMLVNGELAHVHRIREDGLILSSITGREKGVAHTEIKTLEVWLPKTGVYTQRGTTNNKVLLERIPERQWKRSFNPSFYVVEYLTKTGFDILETIPNTWESFWVDSNRTIWFLDLKVGVCEGDGTVTCTDARFVQELQDLSREGLFLEYQR